MNKVLCFLKHVYQTTPSAGPGTPFPTPPCCPPGKTSLTDMDVVPLFVNGLSLLKLDMKFKIHI